MVGRAHAARLAGLGHDVVMGTQDVQKTLAETAPDAMGNPPFSAWHAGMPSVKLAPFADAARHGEIVMDALKGEVAVEALMALREELAGKILIDIANPLDFSKGMPPTLFVCNTDSLGERIQKALPETRVVKAFNTVNARLQTDPAQLSHADHHLFLCGDDADAKTRVSDIARAYGWKHVIDLGDITNARGTEMLLPLWVRLWGALKTPAFNFKIVS